MNRNLNTDAIREFDNLNPNTNLNTMNRNLNRNRNTKKISNMMIVTGTTIACVLTLFLLNVMFLWACDLTVKNFGIIVPAAVIAALATGPVFFRIWRV